MAKQYYIEDNVTPPAIEFTDTAPIGYTLITDPDLLLECTKRTYKQRESDGKEYYNGLRSQLYLDIVNGTYTPAEAFALEQHLKDVKENIVTGNWLTGQSICSALPLSGIFTQELKESIMLDIDTYVNNNY